MVVRKPEHAAAADYERNLRIGDVTYHGIDRLQWEDLEMRGYGGIERSLSACVHFVRNDEVDDQSSLLSLRDDLQKNEIICAYVDYVALEKSGREIVDFLGDALELQHRPYGKNMWVRFLDDLITLSDEVSGLVIIVDSADRFFSSSRNEAFDLIESFLIQFHHWLEKKKPCHLCFQFEENHLIRKVFEPISGRRAIGRES